MGDFDELHGARAYFGQPSAVAAALEVESYLASRGRDAFGSRDVREILKNELRRRGAWILSETFQFYRGHSPVKIDALELVFGRQFRGAVPCVPFTVGFLCVELIPFAVRNCEVDVLELLLESSTFRDFLSYDEQAQTLATAASLLGPHGTADTINILIAHGADVNGARLDASMPMYRSNEAKETTTLDHFVKDGVFTVGLTRVLAHAVHSTRTSESHIRKLIRLGVDVNAKEDAVLHVAARSKIPHFVEILFVDGFADIDARDFLGQTPLMRAAAEYDEVDFSVFWHETTTHSITKLIDLGADLNLQDDFGRTALSLAPIRHHYQVLEVLLQHGASPNIADAEGMTPLHRAHSSPPYMFQVTRVLLDYGADAKVKTVDGKTPLHFAFNYMWEPLKLRETVELLLQHGADPNAQDNTGLTPLHYLSKTASFWEDVVKMFLSHGADLEQHAIS